MVKLVDTSNVSKAREVTIAGNVYVEVPAIGDGNCALNAFALGLIDMIKRDELNLAKDRERLQKLYDAICLDINVAILKERIKLYSQQKSTLAGNPYADLAEGLDLFVGLIENQRPLEDFVNFIKGSTSREQIAALHVGFAPALRQLGVDAYIVAYADDAGVEPAEVRRQERLYDDGVWAGHDVLGALATEVFQVNLGIHQTYAKGKAHISADQHFDDRPSMTVSYTGGHYNYVFPVEQSDGLAMELDAPEETNAVNLEIQEFVTTTDEMVAQIERQNSRKMPVPKEAVQALSDLVATQTDRLVAVEADYTREMNTVLAATEKAKDTVISKLNLDVSSLGLTKTQQTLLGGGVKVAPNPKSYRREVRKQIAADEKLARALQNAEILDFLNSRYDVLTSAQGAHAKRRRHAAPVVESVATSKRRARK